MIEIIPVNAREIDVHNNLHIWMVIIVMLIES
jgi:hypothetical protein